MRQLLFILYFSLLGISLLAQEPSLNDSLQVAKKDSSVTVRKAPKEFKGPLSMFAGKPGRAALYSLAIPGAGQAYNKKYWKVPFVLAAEGVAIGILVHNSKSFNTWDKILTDYYAEPQIIDPRTEDLSGNEIINIRNKKRQFKDYAIIGVVLVHFIQVADAFVNRHLIEFDVSDDLSLNLGNSGPFPSIGFTATF